MCVRLARRGATCQRRCGGLPASQAAACGGRAACQRSASGRRRAPVRTPGSPCAAVHPPGCCRGGRPISAPHQAPCRCMLCASSLPQCRLSSAPGRRCATSGALPPRLQLCGVLLILVPPLSSVELTAPHLAADGPGNPMRLRAYCCAVRWRTRAVKHVHSAVGAAHTSAWSMSSKMHPGKHQLAQLQSLTAAHQPTAGRC